MIRRLFTILSALSLLLCVATCVLWVRSYWHRDWLGWRGGEQSARCVLVCTPGPGWLLLQRAWLGSEGPPIYEPWVTGCFAHGDDEPGTPGFPHTFWERRGFGYVHAEIVPDGSYFEYVQLPAWLVAGAFSAFPAARVWRSRQSRRLGSAGLCPSCGYDLRASPARCPECGAVPARKETA
jgi:predicted RNA-binding Zn-ribbon protein involved in translation (DUF1610 family)